MAKKRSDPPNPQKGAACPKRNPQMAALFISKNAAADLTEIRCHLHCPASIPTYGYPNYGNDGCDGFAPNFPRTGLRNHIQFVGTGSIAIIAWNRPFVKTEQKTAPVIKRALPEAHIYSKFSVRPTISFMMESASSPSGVPFSLMSAASFA